MSYQHAIAKIISTEIQDGSLWTTLTLNRIPTSPIAPASLYMQGEAPIKVIDFHQLVHRHNDLLTFRTFANTISISAGNTYQFIPWWSTAQLELAQDSTRSWRKLFFAPTDMKLFTIEGGQMGRQATEGENLTPGLLVKDGWDHEHCFLGFESISLDEEDMNEGYTDGKDWLCENCYKTYILSGFGKRLGEKV